MIGFFFQDLDSISLVICMFVMKEVKKIVFINVRKCLNGIKNNVVNKKYENGLLCIEVVEVRNVYWKKLIFIFVLKIFFFYDFILKFNV